MKKVMIFITAILFLMPFSLLAATINVPGDQPNIQAGIDAAVDGDIVLLADGTYVGNIIVDRKAIIVKSANGPTNCIIDCQHLGPGIIFGGDSRTPSHAMLKGVTIKNASGVGLWIERTTYVENCVFINNINSESGAGGAIHYSCYSDVFITDCIFIDNNATVGGAIYVQPVETTSSHTFSLSNCTFTGNSASDIAGVFYYSGKPNVLFSFTDCFFTRNSSENSGAVMIDYHYISARSFPSPSCLFSGCSFIDNNSFGPSSATVTFVLSSEYSSFSFSDCTFKGNSSSGNGGAVSGCFYVRKTSSSFDHCIFEDNTTTGFGGAAWFSGSSYATCSFNNCTFKRNNSSGNGGALAYTKWLNPFFRNCTFANNNALGSGGAICYGDPSDSYCTSYSYFIDSTFVSNSSSGNGGAVNSQSKSIFENCIFDNNIAAGLGGAVYSPNYDVEGSFHGCTLTNNSPSLSQPQCQSDNLIGCAIQTDCVNVGGYWYNSTCNVSPQPLPECRADNLSGCNNQAECVDVGGYWYNSTCNDNPQSQSGGSSNPFWFLFRPNRTIPIPVSQSSYDYSLTIDSVIQTNPSDCKPFAVGDLSSGNLNLQVGLPAFSQGVDVYLAIGFADALFLVDDTNVLHPASELTVLPRWKTNNSTAINEALYGDISISLLPVGLYNLYVAVTPTGETDFSHYYFWATNFAILPFWGGHSRRW